MPIIIDELDADVSQRAPLLDELADRLIALESRVRTLEVALRDINNYCHHLEEACRAAFAQRPGLSPFPDIPGR